MKKSLLAITILLFLKSNTGVYGQTIDREAMGVFEKMLEVYKKSDHLAFDITYRYAAEESPGVYLDSLAGHCKLSGNRYWYELDNTESFTAGEFMIMLFKEDKVMYIAKATAPLGPPGGGKEGQLPANFAGNPMDQVAMPDSFFVNNKDITCELAETKEQQVVTIRFKAPAVYKRIEYYIDKQSGYLHKMISVVRSEQLYDASVRSQVQGPVTWAVVECVYSNYSNERFDDNLFNSDRYFKKEGNEYSTVAPWAAYSIFWGSMGK